MNNRKKIYIPFKQNDYVEYRLYEWSKWFRNIALASGYPDRSTVYRIMTEGCIPFETDYSKPLPINLMADEIEQHVVEMHDYHSTLADILRYNYIERRGFRGSAQHFGVSHA